MMICKSIITKRAAKTEWSSYEERKNEIKTCRDQVGWGSAGAEVGVAGRGEGAGTGAGAGL